MLPPEEEPASSMITIGSIGAGAGLPANAVDAATVNAAASTIFFIVFSKNSSLPLNTHLGNGKHPRLNLVFSV